MRFVRFQTKNQEPRFGWIHEGKVGVVEGSIFDEFRRQEATIPLESVSLLAPVLPGKILAIGRNYVAHAKEHGEEVPESPLVFLKPPSSLLDPGLPILLPPQSAQVEHEAELAVVIGRRGRWISASEALRYVLGYTLANDVTARDLQRKDGQWTRAKGFDTFAPIGPWIDTDFDPTDAMITCHVNGVMRQMGSTSEMVFKVSQLIAYCSSIMTLEPGDLIMTGTPAGVSPLAAGDVVEVHIDGLGILSNPVAVDPGRA